MSRPVRDASRARTPPALAASVLAMLCLSVGAARAEDAPPRPMAVGFQLDLLPTVLSAAHGKLGYAPQVWLGIGHARLRLIAAHLELPDAFANAPRGFRDPTITVAASVIDYTFGPRWDGWWVTSGVEVWAQTIAHDAITTQAQWTSAVFTAGGGYIWRLAGDFYLDPWIGVHAILNPNTVTLGDFSYKPFPLQAEASLKVGFFLPI